MKLLLILLSLTSVAQSNYWITENAYLIPGELYPSGIIGNDGFKTHVLGNYSNGDLTVWGLLVIAENPPSDNPWTTDVNYSGSWKISPEYIEGNCNCAYSNTIGDYAEYSFKDGVRIITEKLNTHGSANIYIDGELKETVNLNSVSKIRPFIIEYTIPGEHKLKIEVADRYVVLLGFEKIQVTDCVPDTVFIEKIVYIEKEQDSLISNHNDFQNALEKAIGIDITRKGNYQVRQRPDGEKYIVQPNIEVK